MFEGSILLRARWRPGSSLQPLMFAAALAMLFAAGSQAAQPPDERAMNEGMTSGDAHGDAASDALLRGPDVPQTTARTLVAFDAQGRLVQLDTRPEIAALALLDDLDPVQREAARAAVAERNAALSAFVLDNLDAVRDAADAQAAGKRDRATELSRELYRRFDPERARDPLLEAVRTFVSTEQAAEVQRLVDEYWTARLDRELRNAKDKSDKARRTTQQRIMLGAFQNELRAAYDRTLRPYRQKIDTINRIAEPTPEQRDAIRTIIIDFVRETRLQPTSQQQQEMARKVYQTLDDQQRVKLFEAAFARL